VIAIAVALRHSWRQDQLARFARRLGVSLPTNENVRDSTPTRSRPSRSRFSGSPRPRQGSRFARPARAGCRP
jgi:hypothetical protein